jgi:hypothetical protein
MHHQALPIGVTTSSTQSCRVAARNRHMHRKDDQYSPRSFLDTEKDVSAYEIVSIQKSSRRAEVTTRTGSARAPSLRPGKGRKAARPRRVPTPNSTNRHMCETRQQNRSGKCPASELCASSGKARCVLIPKSFPAHRAAFCLTRLSAGTAPLETRPSPSASPGTQTMLRGMPGRSGPSQSACWGGRS